MKPTKAQLMERVQHLIDSNDPVAEEIAQERGHRLETVRRESWLQRDIAKHLIKTFKAFRHLRV